MKIIGDAIMSPVRKRFPRHQHLVINIRGTNGSGKTTLAKSLKESFPATELYHPSNQLVYAYKLDTKPVKTFLVGPYRITTGGCDAIDESYGDGKPFDFIFETVSELARWGNVVFEGAIVAAKSPQRWIGLADKLAPPTRFIFGFMDTPLEKCLKRVAHRRVKRGDPRPLDPNKSVLPKHNAVRASEKLLKDAGMDVRIVPHKNALPTILSWLKGEK